MSVNEDSNTVPDLIANNLASESNLRRILRYYENRVPFN